MRHYTIHEWTQYVKDELKESARCELEDHLYACDQCLELYLQAVAEYESSLPLLSNETGFADQIMAAVLTQTAAPSSSQNSTLANVAEKQTPTSKQKPFYQQAGFHYLLAAAATLLLTFTGAFQSLGQYANTFETQHKKPSVTEGMVNKTFAWMDALEKKEAVKK